MPEFVFLDINPKVRIPFTCEGADPAMVGAALERACSLIPRYDRRELHDYWQAKLDGPPHFAIENVPYYEEQMDHMHSFAVAKVMNADSLDFRFSGPVMMKVSELLLLILIDHELAHAVLNVERLYGSLPEAAARELRAAGNEEALPFYEKEDLEGAKKVLSKATTEWAEKWADARTLLWDDSLNCELIREWTLAYFKELKLIPE